MVFIRSTDSKSLIFIIIVSILIVSISFLSLFFKFYKFKNEKLKKILSSKNVMYLASFLGLIIGIIFSSLNHFQSINLKNVKSSIWLWECISFVYSVGMYLVALGFIFAWLVIPIVTWKAIEKYLKQDKDFKLEFKKIGLILLMMTITFGIMNLEWCIPFNDLATPLKVFQVNDPSFAKDIWFCGAKYLFDHCFLTIWYPWLFLGYAIFTFIVCFLTAYLINRKNPEKKLSIKIKISDGLCFPYQIIDLLGSVAGFAFISCYFMFNLISFFIHLSLIILSLLAIYSFVNLCLIIIIACVYQKKQMKTKLIINLFKNIFHRSKISQLNPELEWWHQKILDSPAKSWNLCDASIIGLCFTIYLGFANNFDFNSLGQAFFTQKMYDANFWILVFISGFVYNYLAYNQPQNAGLARNFMGASTYSITPGLQTGIFGWIMPSVSKISKFTDNLICMVI